MYDFCLITPVYQGVDGITCWCVEKAHQAGLNFIWYPGTEGKGDALIARGRSIAASAFLEHGPSDYMIFLDSDIVFQPEHLKKLNLHQKKGYDLIGGAYPVRSGTQLASYWQDGEAPDTLGVHKIQFLSTGFMGISKKLLRRLVDELKLPLLHPNTPDMRSYPFFESGYGRVDKPDASGARDIWMSEDWDFCEKCRKIGVEPYIDTTILLGHQGTIIVTMETVKKYKEEQANQEKAKTTEVIEKGEELRDFISEATEGAK